MPWPIPAELGCAEKPFVAKPNFELLHDPKDPAQYTSYWVALVKPVKDVVEADPPVADCVLPVVATAALPPEFCPAMI